TASAVEPFIEVLGAAAFEIGDDKAGVGSRGPGLDAGDDALDPAPTLGGVVELHEPAQLAAAGCRLEALGGARRQRCDTARERRIGGEAEDPIDPARSIAIRPCRCCVMTVITRQDLDLGPMGA